MLSIFSGLLRAAILFAIFVLGGMRLATATPITYELQGVATGTIGGTSFAKDPFALIGTGDTSGSLADGFGDTSNNLYSLTLNLNGFTAASASDPMQFFSSQSGTLVGFTDLTQGSDVFDVSGSDLATYDGISALAPASVSSFFLAAFPTTIGAANIVSAADLTFSASGAPTPIPEPGTVELIILAIAVASIPHVRKRSAARGSL